MIVLVLNHPGSQSGKHFGMRLEFFILILHRDGFVPIYVFSDIRNAQTTFIKSPEFPFFLQDFGIDKYLFESEGFHALCHETLE